MTTQIVLNRLGDTATATVSFVDVPAGGPGPNPAGGPGPNPAGTGGLGYPAKLSASGPYPAVRNADGTVVGPLTATATI